MTCARRAIAVAIACVSCISTAAQAADDIAGVRLGQLPQAWHDERGRGVALAGLGPHRVVLTMAYAGCRRICPSTMLALARLQHLLDGRGERADFVIIGYSPEAEDAATWRSYRARHRLDRDNWHFLSGSRDDTERLARQLGFEYWKYDEHVMHDSRVVVFDDEGRLTAVLDPTKPDWPAAL
jgi:protein SCO1/2